MAGPRPFIGLMAGIAAGLVASAAMAAFQAAAEPLLPEGDEDPSTVKAADAVGKAVTGKKVAEPYREASGHGVLTEYRPEASAGFGSAYGIATSTLLDEAAVPALDLGPAPDEAPIESHIYGVAAHLVYGIVLEGVRRLVAGKR
jgi:putative membrane protein